MKLSPPFSKDNPPGLSPFPREEIRQLLSSRARKVPVDASQDRLSVASVLVPLYPKDQGYHLILNRRGEEVLHHKGEIAFPGGTQDPEDRSPLDTALREAFEEMGISREVIDVLGELDPVPTPTGFLIHPFVAVLPYPCSFRINPKEVSEVLEVPLYALFNPEHVRDEVHVLELHPLKRYTMKTFVYGHHVIYGATGRIVTQLLDLLREIWSSGR